MKQHGLNDLREMFLSFFEEKGHLRLNCFSLIPQGDASLLLINSGMAPMKPWFTGEQEPPRRRVCTCQKCIRTGDIDSVGRTSRHGTYFEMLGNFSFGDYFKHDAIVWCWEFLTERVGLDPALLYPSVYTDDEEAYNIWKDVVGIAPERIVKLGRDDNFWDHGSGPCGPCSEVYFDRGGKHGCGKPDCAPGCSCDRFVEVWNNVFTQFNNDGAGNYTELAQKNIDTGLGLERLACVCQGVDSIFEIDTIKSIVDEVVKAILTENANGQRLREAKTMRSETMYGQNAKSDVSIRIITDHMRASTMMICDGILPSNEGRGYVLRRLIRRAARHGRLLGIEGAFLTKISEKVICESKCAYPELAERADFIKRVLQTEEAAFGKTIDAGMAMLGDLTDKLKQTGGTELAAADAFKLYDTFGFPLDLTIDILAEKGMTADTEGFEREMQAQRARARKAREALGDLAWEKLELGADNTPTEFIGYETLCEPAAVLAIVAQGEPVSVLQEGGEGLIVLDRTPFYAEKGGQTADTGLIIQLPNSEESLSDEEWKNTPIKNTFVVTDVKLAKSGKYLHYGYVRNGAFSVGDTVLAGVDASRRGAISRAHSATHLLHKALRAVLGEHVNQAGSLVEPDRLRFDFTHFAAMTEDETAAVERLVNDAILSNHAVEIEEMPIDKAKELGAAALFGEKYGDIVRVVKMGESVELCGGTHLECTARAGMFTIISEGSIASGVRRIEAITGPETLELLRASRRHLRDIAAALKVGADDEILGKVEQNTAQLREMRSKLESAQAKASGNAARDMLEKAKDIGGLKVVTALIDEAAVSPDGVSADKLRQTADSLRDLSASVVAVLAMNKDGKLTIVAACGKAAVERGVKAGDLVRSVTKLCGGSGGGKPEFAMGGAKDASRLAEAFELVETIVSS